jgi:hypothetical protein
MSLGKATFELTKTDYASKLGRIISNHRANSKLIGEPAEFVLRSCRLTERWVKLANDAEVMVYLRNIDTAGGRKVKMLSLERGATKQPVPKQKLVDELYPVKRTAVSATPEEKHYNAVKASMRHAIYHQLKEYRDAVVLPTVCQITGKKIRLGMKTDVDHTGLTFSEIADIFLHDKGMSYSDITLKGPPTAKVFKDETLWKEWVEFHYEKARFALALASANRSKGCGDYCTPKELLGSFAKEDPEDLALDF